MAKIKYGNVNIPEDEFKSENMTAHLTVKLRMSIVEDMKRLGGDVPLSSIIEEAVVEWIKARTMAYVFWQTLLALACLGGQRRVLYCRRTRNT